MNRIAKISCVVFCVSALTHNSGQWRREWSKRKRFARACVPVVLNQNAARVRFLNVIKFVFGCHIIRP
jgi:hypothetical protein